MTRPPDELARLLRHHPSAAISVAEARELLSTVLPDGPPPNEDTIVTLAERDPQLRLLAPRRDRWAGAGPNRWIILHDPDAPLASRTLPDLLRRSLHCIGQALEPGSTRSLARWERLLREERKVTRVLRRRLRSRATAPATGSTGNGEGKRC